METDFDAANTNTDDNGNLFGILSTVVFFIFTLGIAAGSVYCAKCANVSSDINSRFTAIFDYISGGCSSFNISINVLARYLVICAVVILAAKFKYGFVFSFFAVLREGFINGFTLSSAVSAFGAKGIVCMGTIALEYITAAAILIMLTSVSATLSATGEKKFKKFLIFFSILAVSIFCGLSFFRGYISTIFIKIMYSKIL